MTAELDAYMQFAPATNNRKPIRKKKYRYIISNVYENFHVITLNYVCIRVKRKCRNYKALTKSDLTRETLVAVSPIQKLGDNLSNFTDCNVKSHCRTTGIIEQAN